MMIGYGTRAHEGALLTAGAEKVFYHPDELSLVVDLAGFSVRAEDTLIMVQPGLLTLADMRILRNACNGDLKFQVVGHDAFPLPTDRLLKEFRKLKPRVAQTEIIQLTGRPRSIDYTPQQAEQIIRMWHALPRQKPTQIVANVEIMLNLEPGTLKTSWVRDVVIKYVGTAQRDKPAHWKGVGDG